MDYNLALEPNYEGPHYSRLSFPEHQSLHMFLNLLLRILKTGHGERVRSVVDSPVIASLRAILDGVTLFGGYITTLASKLLAAIIHNEPTSYAALHENGLPQAFLKMVMTNIPPTSELVNALPNVFDAICINVQGRELFSQAHLEAFFKTFGSLEHCKVMTKCHHASDTGASMDELIRHHPDLKDVFLKSYVQMLREICAERIQNEPPVGNKLPELMDATSFWQGDQTTWQPTGIHDEKILKKARAEEEHSLPVLLLIRNVVHVLLSPALSNFSSLKACSPQPIG